MRRKIWLAEIWEAESSLEPTCQRFSLSPKFTRNAKIRMERVALGNGTAAVLSRQKPTKYQVPSGLYAMHFVSQRIHQFFTLRRDCYS